jgi:hypothetical protein
MYPYLTGFDDRVAFWYSDYTVINETNAIVGRIRLPSFDPKEVIQRGDFLATGTIYRKKFVADLLPDIWSMFNSGVENYELVLHLLLAGYVGVHIPEPLFSYRCHHESFSHTGLEHIKRNGVNLFHRLGLGLYRWNDYHPSTRLDGHQ